MDASAIVMLSDALRLDPKHNVVILNQGDKEIVVTITTSEIGGMRLARNEANRAFRVEPHGNISVFLYPLTDITIAHPKE